MSTSELTVESEPRTGRLVTGVLAAVVLVYALLEAMLAPALPLIQQGVGASTASVAWVFTGLLLAGTVCTPLIGRLADLYTKKTLFLVVLGIVLVGVLLAALATNIVVLAAGQILQGAGLGFVPLAVGLLRETQPDGRARTGNGVIIGMSALGAVGGVLLAGPILAVLPYTWLYWLPLGVLVAIGVVAVWALPSVRPTSEGKVDWTGAALLSAGLLAVLIALTQVPVWGWGSPEFLGLAGLGVVLLVAFGVVELRLERPLVDLRGGGRPVIITWVVGFAVGWSTYAVFLALPTIVATPPAVGYGLGGTAGLAGLLLLPLGAVGAVSASATPLLERMVGQRALMALSCVPVVAAASVLFLARHDGLMLAVSAGLMGLGVGVGLTQAMNIVSSVVPAERIASSSGLLFVVRGIGGLLGAQVSGSVLASDLIPGTPLPTWSAFGTTFVIATVVGVAALAASLALPRQLATT